MITSETDTAQVIVFEVGAETYAIAVHDVESINRFTTATSVPEAPHEVRGVVDVRGRLISIYDLRRRFGHPALDDESSANVLVLRPDLRDVGLMVDDVTEVATIAVDDHEPAPPEATSAANFVLGVIRHNDALVMLLDINRVLGDQVPPSPSPPACTDHEPTEQPTTNQELTADQGPTEQPTTHQELAGDDGAVLSSTPS